MDISSVELWIYSEEAGAFTVAWKAFEHELIINSIKADLVQLNGYYQYVPKMKCECQINAEFKYAEIIKKVVEGQHVTEMISSHDLSSCWEVPEYKLADVAEFLRSIGYEIRNNSTNPQIQEGYWLVPYAFPTLTPQSVQLRKRVK